MKRQSIFWIQKIYLAMVLALLTLFNWPGKLPLTRGLPRAMAPRARPPRAGPGPAAVVAGPGACPGRWGAACRLLLPAPRCPAARPRAVAPRPPAYSTQTVCQTSINKSKHIDSLRIISTREPCVIVNAQINSYHEMSNKNHFKSPIIKSKIKYVVRSTWKIIHHWNC